MKIKEIKEGLAATYKILKTGPEGTTLQSPDMHTTLTLDPEASKGIVQSPDNPDQFVLSAAQAAGTTNQAQPVGPKQGAQVEIPATEGMGDDYDLILDIDNPNWDENDENSYDTIRVGVNYSISGRYRPATWGYHGGEPEEHPELDDVSVVDVDTGEDVSDKVNMDEIEQAIWKHEKDSEDDYYDEDIKGEEDPTDSFISDVTDKEFEKSVKSESEELSHIRKLSGL